MIDTSAFKAVVGRFATGVTVVTTRDAQGNLAGLWSQREGGRGRGAVLLASDESSFMTGSDLLVDSGYTVR